MQVAISNEGPCYSMITEKKTKKNITCVWFLVYSVSTSYRYIRCDEIVLLPITLDFRQGVRENFMKGQGVRVRIKVKNHCFMHMSAVWQSLYVCVTKSCCALLTFTENLHPWSSYKMLIKCTFCNFTLWMTHCLRCPGPSPRSPPLHNPGVGNNIV